MRGAGARGRWVSGRLCTTEATRHGSGFDEVCNDALKQLCVVYDSVRAATTCTCIDIMSYLPSVLLQSRY